MSDREYLQRAVKLGDQLSEALELLLGDPVIDAYRSEIDWMQSPYGAERGKHNALLDALNSDWDELVGELQRAGIADEGPKGNVNVDIEHVQIR